MTTDLIYIFDGGGRWVLELAALLLLFAGALWAVLDDNSFLYDDDEDHP